MGNLRARAWLSEEQSGTAFLLAAPLGWNARVAEPVDREDEEPASISRGRGVGQRAAELVADAARWAWIYRTGDAHRAAAASPAYRPGDRSRRGAKGLRIRARAVGHVYARGAEARTRSIWRRLCHGPSWRLAVASAWSSSSRAGRASRWSRCARPRRSERRSSTVLRGATDTGNALCARGETPAHSAEELACRKRFSKCRARLKWRVRASDHA